MPPAPKAKKKVGPFTTTGWFALGGGTLVLFYLYRRYTAASSGASTATTGGTSIPGGAVTTTTPGAPQYTSWAQWEAAAIAALTGPHYSATQAFNDLTAWYNGNCVSAAGFNAIGGFLATAGLPPGGSSTPLSVCPTASSTGSTGSTSPPAGAGTHNAPANQGPPALPTALAQAMSANGENIVGTAWDSAKSSWLYLTNKGGVYSLTPTGGSGFFAGSYLGLPAAATQVAPGAPQRTFSQVKVDAAGGYTLVATDGGTYHFGP